MFRRIVAVSVVAVVAVAVCACSSPPTGPDAELELLEIAPTPGATVSPTAVVSLRFSHEMMPGMSAFLAVHDGDVTGPMVPGRWGWTDDYRTVRFTPDEPFQRQHRYTLHIGGGLQDREGRWLNVHHAQERFGAEWCTGERVAGRPHYRMGAGWRHPDGGYGLLVSFETS